MRMFLVFFGCIVCLTSHAKIGETIAQVEARYGEAAQGSSLDLRLYKFNGFKVTVKYYDDRSVFERLVSGDPEKTFTPDECFLLADAIAGKGEWKMVPGNDTLFSKMWQQGKVAFLIYEKKILNPAEITVLGYDFAERILHDDKEQMKDLANRFGASPVEKRPDPSFDNAQREGLARERQLRIERSTAAMEKERQRRLEIDAKVLKSQQERAGAGYPSAQYDLGMRYVKGDGVPQDKVLAFEWLQKAAAQGYDEAKAALAKLQTHSNARD